MSKLLECTILVTSDGDKVSMAMLAIFLMSYELKILCTVIPFPPIFVIGFKAFWNPAHESVYHESVNISLEKFSTFSVQTDASITSTFVRRFENFNFPKTETSNQSGVADFIE